MAAEFLPISRKGNINWRLINPPNTATIMPPAIIFNPFILLSLFFLISSTIATTISTPEYVYSYCPNTTTFAANSSYQKNLNSVLTSLSSNSTTQSGFYNTTAGDGRASTVYGIFLCRGDDTKDVCRTCVTTAVKAVQENCPNRKQAIIWYDVCMIRYSNASFFGELDESTGVYLVNENSITNNVTGFTNVLGNTMNKTARLAAKGQSGKKFATADANFNSSQKLYTLAQCTPDLSPATAIAVCRCVLRSFQNVAAESKAAGCCFLAAILDTRSISSTRTLPPPPPQSLPQPQSQPQPQPQSQSQPQSPLSFRPLPHHLLRLLCVLLLPLLQRKVHRQR
ncbi:hypothetical protein Nepgr_007190 [Nepenthes gracilis]|uniref:Gnk2-homologous domain-containing protein n=1 Tax=Nepenthes gracilis TaxID=150966 RepID=A0AAD3S6H4_NEPGR|nr:hypothetical protein Nepgr_007190 [Nepenthes gracilis]